MEKHKKNHTTTINLKYEFQHGMANLNYLSDHILYQIFKISFILSKKKHGEKIDNPSIRIYVNKIENRITLKIKKGYHLEPLTPETMKSFGSSENKITKDKNGENIPHLEITEVALVHCNFVNNGYQQDSRFLYTFVTNKQFDSLLQISPTCSISLKIFNSEPSHTEVWVTYQNSQPLEIEDRINLTLVIKCL